MQEYLYNNQVITEADLLAEADKRDISLKTLMENNKDKYSADQLFQAAIEVADILKVTQGYEGVMSFWENQINKIIVDFYNKDLINVSEVEITANEDNLYTVAGSNTEPSNRSDKFFGFEDRLIISFPCSNSIL